MGENKQKRDKTMKNKKKLEKSRKLTKTGENKKPQKTSKNPFLSTQK